MIKLTATIIAAAVLLTGCSRDAQVAAQNLSHDADNFKINRRVIFYNGITGDYVLSIEGMCALDAENSRKISITCKISEGSYKKHYLGLSDNVTYFIEQLEPAKASVSNYKVTFKPSVIIPDVTMR